MKNFILQKPIIINKTLNISDELKNYNYKDKHDDIPDTILYGLSLIKNKKKIPGDEK